jgi:hypothetical protein
VRNVAIILLFVEGFSRIAKNPSEAFLTTKQRSLSAVCAADAESIFGVRRPPGGVPSGYPRSSSFLTSAVRCGGRGREGVVLVLKAFPNC